MASSSTFPDWALLDRYVLRRDDHSFPVGEPTEASGTNSRDDKIRVCFQLIDPSRPSRLYLSWPGGMGPFDQFSVVAVHRDTVLFQMTYPIPVPRHTYPYDMYGSFLYRTNDGSLSLDLLPYIVGTMVEFRALFGDGIFRYKNQHLCRVQALDIAVLHRGDDDVVVVELQVITTEEPELRIIFPSRSSSMPIQWEVKKPRIIHGPDLDLEHLLWHWSANAVIPFGSYLCWIDYYRGVILLCKVFDDNLELQYLA